MMHFFKKETKEEKERKKIEKKTLKETSLITTFNPTTTTISGSASSSQSLLSTKQLASDSGHFSNINSYLRHQNNNNNNNDENLNTNDHPYSNKISNESNLNEDLSINTSANKNNTKQAMSSIIKPSHSSSSSSSTTTTITTKNNSESNNAPTPSIIATNSALSTPQLLPKPKKGILKTMSKFGIGPTLSTITPTIAPNQILNTPPPPTTTTVASPKPSKFNGKQQLDQLALPSYSKRNSQILNSNSLVHDFKSNSLTKNIVNQLNNGCNFLLPSLRNIPVHLNDINQIKFENNNFIRTIRVPADLMDKLELLQLDEDNSDEDLSRFIFISCDPSLGLDFLPGDQLIAVNGVSVLEKNKMDVKSLLEQNHYADSNLNIAIQVRTSLKCSELISRNICDSIYYSDKKQINVNSSLHSLSSSSISSNSSASTNTPHSDESEIDTVWLVHTNGYSLVKIVSKSTDTTDTSDSSKFRVKLENGNVIEVNEENLEKINPSPQFDFCEDLSRLRFINESSLIHAIRQRYHTLKLIHTNIGSNCLLILKPSVPAVAQVNQLELLSSNPTSVYSDPIISKFKGKKLDDMPPHIYSYTQSVYRNMLSTRQDQSIILMGHSGSAKSFNSKLILNYLFKIAAINSTAIKSTVNANFTEIKLNALYCLLNAFCCVSTDKNLNGSNRFLNVFLLEFNHSGQLASILVQLIALDYTRLVYQPNEESNYLIFYYLLYGSDSPLKSELQLNNITIGKNSGNLLFQSEIDTKLKGENAKERLHDILESFKILSFSESEIKSVISILAAIIHLSKADATQSQSSSRNGQFLNPNEAHKAASLLGITFQQLNDSVFSLLSSSSDSKSKYGHLSNSGSAKISPDANADLNLDPIECLHGFCIGLYQECLNLLVNFINRAFKPTSTSNAFNYQQPIANSMLIIDPPGFQYHPVNSNIKTNAASYSDLMCNYLCERLQLMFYQINFINPIEKCAQEGLDIDLVEHIPESPSALVNWFDRPSTVRGTPSGLLTLLEEHISSDSKSCDQFMRKLIDSDQKQNFLSTNNQNFTIHHQFGLFPVEYCLNKWLEFYCKDYPTHRNASVILYESKKECVSASVKLSSALSNVAAAFNNSSFNFNAVSSLSNGESNPAAPTSLKRQASVRKMLTMSKRKSFKVNFKLQLDSIFDSMRRTKCNFVFCALPVQSVPNQQQQQNFLMLTEKLDVPLLRSQLKAHQILAACRIYRQGYPEHLNFEEFERRFSMFIVNNSNDSLPNHSHSNDDHKQACVNLIKIFDIDSAFFKFGTTQIFFKAGVLNKLNDKRDEKLNDLIIKLQANCRRYLAVKSLEKRRIQDSAIKCIQKNVRISFALKKWKWWRLYTQLMPIINVQNNETLFKQCKEELEDIKRKNERLINEKNELKLLNNQLESKLMNLQTEYVEEHATNAGTLDLLEVETSERMRLERELNELRPAYNESLKKLETLETEMLEMRLFATKKSIEHELEKDDIDGLSSFEHVIPGQIEKIRRENENLKQKLQQDKENSLLFNQNERNFFELKLKEKDNEILEMEKQLAVQKRKCQKLSEDMQDVQRLCDESKVRNRDLEKIQLRFDAEMTQSKSKYEKEKELREKCERERESSKYEIFSLKNELETQKLEINYHVEKCERLERDIKEYESVSVNGNSSASSIQSNTQFMKMKSQIRDMESKIKDQEEELDDQQGTIQQLEQAKLKLEMQFEKEKQKFQRELAEKDSEMDDLRFHTQKKIKAIEMQLEEESDLTNNLQREKREIERKLRELTANNSGKKGFMLNGISNNGHGNDIYEYINKLKRNMAKYKTLAIDAQTQLEKLRENLPKQSIIKSLKLQLEDSEFIKSNALKSKEILQAEIINLQQQLDDLNFFKQNLEEQNLHLNRELNNLRSQIEEHERDADENLTNYKNLIQKYSLDSHRFIDLNNQIDLITIENKILKEKIREMEEKVNYYEDAYVDKSVVNKLESKLRDLECKYDFEAKHKIRIQAQLERAKQQNEASTLEIDTLSLREKKCEEMLKKSQRQYKDTLEEFGDIRKKLIDLEETKKRLEQQNEILERELDSAKSEIKINQNRLDAFQNAFNAMNNEDESDESYDEDDDDEDDDENYTEEDYDGETPSYTITKINNSNGGDNRLNQSLNGTVNSNIKQISINQ